MGQIYGINRDNCIGQYQSEDSVHLQEKLLRLRKAQQADYESTRTVYDYYEGHVKPAIGKEDWLVQMRKCKVSRALLQHLNANLSVLDDLQRNDQSVRDTDLDEFTLRAVRARRVGDKLNEDEAHGLLVQDMQPREGEFLIDFKPKWLLQSPTAPISWTRCRTCALNAQKVSKSSSQLKTRATFCPLALISGSAKPVSQMLEGRLGDAHPADAALVQSYLLHGEGSKILRRLHHLQAKLDRHGALELVRHDGSYTKEDYTDLALAMTLRDTTFFIRGNSSEQQVEGRLADLDCKPHSRSKRQEWASKERDLIDGCWYEGESRTCVGRDGSNIKTRDQQAD